MRAVWLVARDSEPPVDPIALLEGILKGHFETTVKNGGVLVSTSDEGQSASFMVPEGLDAGTIMEFASEGIDWFQSQGDPPDFSKDCQPRLQLGFAVAPT